MTTKRLTPEEVKRHASARDLFVIVHGRVYDLTKFLEEHPGGMDVLLELGGQDATEAFEEVGHSADARKLLEGFQVGFLKGYESEKDKPKSGGGSVATLSGPQQPSFYHYIACAVVLLGVGVPAWLYYY